MGFKQRPRVNEDAELLKRIGSACQQARQERGLTQRDVADKLGVDLGFYVRVEEGQACPSFYMFIQLIDLLGVSADSVLASSIEFLRGQHNGA